MEAPLNVHYRFDFAVRVGAVEKRRDYAALSADAHRPVVETGLSAPNYALEAIDARRGQAQQEDGRDFY